MRKLTDQQILDALKEYVNGHYFNLTKEKDLGQGIRKETDMKFRFGINYSHMAINKDKDIGSLPWGHWVPGLENLVIEHTKVLDKKTGETETNYYLRVTSCDPAHPESGADVIATRYIDANGNLITKAEAIAIVGEKKLQGSPRPVYNIKFSNIIKIGK